MKLANINKNALFIIFEGIIAAMILNLYSPYVQMFARRMGAQDMHIALLNSIPPLVAIFVLIPFSLLIDRVKDKKIVTELLILVNGLFYLAIVFVPFIPDRAKVIMYVLLIGLMNWPGSLYLTTWQSFYSDTFSGAEANLLYSQRSKYSAFFGLLTVLLTGYIISAVPGNETERIVIYQIFYAFCFIFSIVQIMFLSRVKSPRTSEAAEKPTNRKMAFNLKEFGYMISNKRFMIFCLCAFAFHISWQMGWPLFFLYNVDCIKIGEFEMGIISVGSGLASFLSYSMWNWIIKKKGNSFAMIFGALGLAANPFFFTWLMPFYLVVFVQAIAGVFGAGLTLTLFCGLLEILPESKKTLYISTYNTFINISGFFSPLVGVLIYKHTGMYLAMFIVGVARVLMGMFFIWRWYAETRRDRLHGGVDVPSGVVEN